MRYPIQTSATPGRRVRSALVGVAAALVACGVPVALGASTDTVKVTGPKHLKVEQHFSVGGKGHANKKAVLFVTIHRHGKCAGNYAAEKASGSYIAIAREVGPGDYKEKREDLHFTGKSKGHYCAYLYKPTSYTSDKPLAKSSKKFKVTE